MGRECVGLGVCRECPRGGDEASVVMGRYLVQAFLASGYYADVFEAHDALTGDEVALKVYADDPPRRSAWTHEIAALRQLAHPRIPRLRGDLDRGGWLLVAMDLVGGVDLRALVESEGPLGHLDAVRAGVEVAEALESSAALGWTYRDLHPRNVHLRTSVGAMLLDFDGARPPGWPACPAGRIGYRAPELDAAGGVTPACDVYSLAGCLYFALTGSDPRLNPGALRWPPKLARFAPLTTLLDTCRVEMPESRPPICDLARGLRALRTD